VALGRPETGPIVQVAQLWVINRRRSRRRAWKVAQRAPMPVALLLITTSFAVDGRIRPVPVDEEPAVVAVLPDEGGVAVLGRRVYAGRLPMSPRPRHR